LPLPELIPGSTRDDVFITPALITPKPLPPLTTEPTILTSEGDVRITYASIGTFRVTQGREIQYERFPDVTDEEIRLFILGPMLGVLLHQRGLLTLHGSCVSIGHKAVTFLAPSTGGKSTMAGMLCNRGHELLADDITAVEVNADSVMVYPAVPHLKLWPETALFLGHSPDVLPRIHPAEEKRLLFAHEYFSLTPVPLKQIIILSDSEDLSLNRLSKQEATMELLRHSYCAQLPGCVSPPEYFMYCAALAKVTPVYRLSRPRMIEKLSNVVDLVEQNLAHMIDG
jgi:hypothetical protein